MLRLLVETVASRLWIYFLVIPEDVLCIHRSHYFLVCFCIFLYLTVRPGISIGAQKPFKSACYRKAGVMKSSVFYIKKRVNCICFDLCRDTLWTSRWIPAPWITTILVESNVGSSCQTTRCHNPESLRCQRNRKLHITKVRRKYSLST